MSKLLKIIVALPAILFIIIGLRWLVDPAGVAGEFGMPLLDGLGRSTQIGDLSAFFISGGAMALIGVATQRSSWLYAPAMLLALTAFGRTVAWLVHDASLAIPQIAVEIVVAVLLLFAASKTVQATPGN